MLFDFSYFLEVFPKIVSKLQVTLTLTLTAAVFSLIIGVIIAVIGYYKIKFFYPVTRLYLSVLRGTPLVAQLYFFYYGLARISEIVLNMKPMTAVALVLSLNTGAFMSESIRGALLSVDPGQKEAAAMLGMSEPQTIVRIVLPQAFRAALPALFNDLINLLKATSLAFMLGIRDIMGQAKSEGAQSFRYFEIYLAVMLIYWILVLALTQVHKVLDVKCSKMY
ncbi:MAG: amino acid ABC transporter permease [Hungatella sp.]|nr:amino acid ABC transporter permease [Hungatella sp.]